MRISTSLELINYDRNKYCWNITGELEHLQSELITKLDDFIQIHKIVYKEITSIRSDLDTLEFSPIPQELLVSMDLDECEYRKDQYIEDKHEATISIKNFVDQITIVGLWAISEQLTTKVLVELCKRDKQSISSNWLGKIENWDARKTKFLALGIDLTTCDNFENADECRVLNNKIKHTIRVEEALAKFSYFKPYEGCNLDEVPLDVERYLTGVADFLGSLIKLANETITLP